RLNSKDFLSHMWNPPEVHKWDLYGRRNNGPDFSVALALHPFPTAKGTWILASIEDTSMRRYSEESLHRTRAAFPVFPMPSFSDAAPAMRSPFSKVPR